MFKSNRLKIGLALGSGGPKGLAHIGVIKVLEENNIPIDFIAGSSIGAMVGGYYAATKDVKKMEEITLESNWRQVLSFIDPAFGQGLIGGEKIKKFLKKHIGEVHFQDLKIPLSVVATDLKSGDSVCLAEGEVASAVRASISFPLVFKPIKQNDHLLTDGGLSCPVPVDIVRKMGADLVIAVNLDADYFTNGNDEKVNFGFYKIANNSINLLRHHLASWNAKNADIVITPRSGIIHWNKFLEGENIISNGEKAMREQLDQLQELMKEGPTPPPVT